jgi:nucleoside-diphosphate-sugar epimerase
MIFESFLVTGSTGAVGTHVVNLLKDNGIDYKPHDTRDFSLAPQADHIIHIAGINRGDNLHFGNIQISKTLTEQLSSRPQTLTYANSVKSRFDDSEYAKGKRGAELHLRQWCRENGILFRNCYLPNLIGPFGKPNHNMIATTIVHNLVYGIELPPLNNQRFGMGLLSDAAIELCRVKNWPRNIQTYETSAQDLATRSERLLENQVAKDPLDHAIVAMIEETRQKRQSNQGIN